jgi:hypothetical protein
MAIRFDCPNCKTQYEVADDLAGKMIMCRGCQKRGAVRGLGASTATLTAAGASAAPVSSRRTFLIGLGVASLGAIATGALLARQPWRRWGGSSDTPSSERGRGRGRPRPPDAGKDTEKKGPGV